MPPKKHIHFGRDLLADVRLPRCENCGMDTGSWNEYHPEEACQLYELLGDPVAVRSVLPILRAKLAREQGVEAEDEIVQRSFNSAPSTWDRE